MTAHQAAMRNTKLTFNPARWDLSLNSGRSAGSGSRGPRAALQGGPREDQARKQA
jgi:hypothetical protein